MTKSTLILLLLLLNSYSGSAQEYRNEFLGVDYMSYKGTLLILKEKPISGFNYSFYGDLKFCQKVSDGNVLYPEVNNRASTEKDSLRNKVFQVEDVVGKDGNPFISKSSYDNPIFILRDTVTDQRIFFIYHTRDEHKFPFLTSLTIDPTKICERIERTVDDFTGEVRLNSPLSEGRLISPVGLLKSITDGKSSYYLSLHTSGETVNFGQKGAIVLFADGTKISKPSAEINVTYNTNKFEYRAFVPITEAELKMLQTKSIKKFRLYIYDEEISEGLSERFMHYVQCLAVKK